jgi:superoxide dismutase, Fe-Mn family
MLASHTRRTEFPRMPDVSRQTYPFSLPALPYPYGALEPHIDETTMRIHHDKHHQAYVDKLNEALAKQTDLQRLTLIELLRDVDKLPEKIRAAVRNNGGGHWNHDLFWRSLAPAARGEPRGELGSALQRQFGGLEAFREKFTSVAAAHFASGWVALVFEPSNGQLGIVDLKDHEVPRPWETTALLIVDVWEHAYYVKYQNRRPEFLAAFWKVVDWAGAEERFDNGRSAARV